MTAGETPPNSPSMHSDVNDNEDDIIFDENDVVEVLDDNEGAAAAEDDMKSEDEAEEEEVLPERDDAQTIFTQHNDGVLCCDFHPTSNYIVATGGIDDNAFIWNSTNGSKYFTCKGHEDSVEIVSFSCDGNYLATADLNGVIKIWRTRDFSLIETFEIDDEISWIQWHNKTNVLVASSQIGMIYMYKIPNGERKLVMASFGQNCIAGKILPDGKSLACGYKNGNLKIIDLRQGVVLKDVKPYDEIGGITCLDIHKSNNLILCGYETGAVLLINSSSGKIASVLQGCQNLDGCNYVEAVSFCKNCSYDLAASGALDGTLVIWDIVRQTVRHKHKFFSCVNHIIWHPNLPVLFTCHFEGVARAYDARAGTIVKEYLGHHKSCLNMSLSSDGSLLMTTSEDKTVRIFSVGNFL